jgi:hypothetical protein
LQRQNGSFRESAQEAPASAERYIPRLSLKTSRRQTMSIATEIAPEAQVKAETAVGVGSRKLFENDKIIVWDFVLPAGEETPVHTHDHSYMWFAVQGAPLQIYDEHGNDVGLFPVPTNGIFELKVEDGTIEVMSEIGKGVKVPARHSARNVGKEDYREILVEWK